jgi:predicted Zn finger-like uncharacterized protein
MLTQCPSCQTTFRVTSEILRVAQGQVRCGRCQTQFDALERLIEENDAGEIQSGRFLRPPREEPVEESIEVEEPQEQEDITLEGRHIEITGTYRVLDESGRQEHFEQEVTEEWVEISEDEILDEAAPEQDEAAEEIEDEIESEDYEEESSDETRDAADDDAETIYEEDEEEVAVDPVAAEQRAALRGLAAQEPVHQEPELFAPRPKPPAPPLWTWLAAPLAFLLAIQMVHHSRAILARHPRIGPALVSVYGALGIPLQPDWNLHAYEVRQWGVASDPASPGTLRVRASIKNLAEYAQPYPLLKLVLEDRWGEQVRAREFEPSEYLDPSMAPDRLLAPAQQTNATIAIVDPGPDAEGFRFDVCLRGAHGPVCAGDVPARR